MKIPNAPNFSEDRSSVATLARIIKTRGDVRAPVPGNLNASFNKFTWFLLLYKNNLSWKVNLIGTYGGIVSEVLSRIVTIAY